MILQGNSLYKLKEINDNSIDSIITDPPYELGFMGKSWDNSGIAYNIELWKECLRVLKPGGHLLAFSGTRTYHRMAVAIEDAGFEVRDMIEWVYGSGFPKSLNIGKAGDFTGGEYDLTKGTSEYEGWGTALKPAHEPICMARKPLAEKTVAENCLKWGTGGINIDESRVEGIPPSVLQPPLGVKKAEIYNFATGEARNGEMSNSSKGRFPANLIHDNSEEVRECFPETKTGAVNKKAESVNSEYAFSHNMITHTKERPADSGNASRFFKSIIYQAKASKKDRGEGNNHPTVKPIALMEYLIKMVTPKDGTVLDPFAGSGSTLVAAKENGFNYIGIEMIEEYIPIIEARLNAVNCYKQQGLFE